MDALREMEDNAFDLAIVDPPYGIGVKTNMGRRAGVPNANPRAEWDERCPTTEYFTELMRVSKNQIIWGANHFISKMPFDSPFWIAWDKGFSPEVSFAQFELAWTSLNGTCKRYDCSPNQQGRIHPTQKPIELYKWLLQNYAKEGDRILDTHLGSASIALACWDLGFDLTGYELDEDYFNAGFQRLETHKTQGQFEFA
tara:strand:- start:771 stop:1364 length:594 start_codon:yes stop_codon:yes gene_type:complete